MLSPNAILEMTFSFRSNLIIQKKRVNKMKYKINNAIKLQDN